MEKAENGRVNTGGEKRVEQAERSIYRTPARVDGRLAGLRLAQRPSSALVRTRRAGAGTRGQGQEGEDTWTHDHVQTDGRRGLSAQLRDPAQRW